MTSPPESAPTPATTADESDNSEPAISAARLAALTGFDDPTVRQQNNTSTATSTPQAGEMSDEEIEAELSRHTFASHPLSKIVVVFGGVLVIVTLGGFFIYSLTGAKLSRKHAPPSGGDSAQAAQAPTSDREKAKLLTELAVKDQEQQLRAIDLEKPTSKSKPKTPRKVTPPARPVPIVRPLPQPQPIPVVRQFVRVPQQQTKPISPVQQDPYEQWLQASKLGSYGSVPITPPQPDPIPAATATAVQYASSSETPVKPTVYSPKDILVGTQAEAALVAPIVFSDRLTQESLRYIVRLTQPLVAADGTSVFPAGTQIVTRLVPDNPPLVTLTAEAFLLQQGQNWVEYPLPKDALFIGGSDFNPPIAKQKRVGRDRRNRTDEVGTALDAVDIAGDVLDLPMNDLPSQVYRRIGRKRYNQTSESVSQVYFLPANSKVRVVVNQTFSPLESDRSLTTDKEAEKSDVPLGGLSAPVVAPPASPAQPAAPSRRTTWTPATKYEYTIWQRNGYKPRSRVNDRRFFP